ncbi:MAG: ABC transporter permease subunit [Candidatus Hydrogenedentes bacterium]|nr:ABC transporter permease subunit [Candidatus Hydrogenedentota bacterium]
MIWRIYTAFTVELGKALRRKTTYAAPLLVVAAVALTLAYEPISRDGVSDYAFIAYVTPLALDSVGLILLLLFSASLVSPELGSGNIRQILVRPLLRHEYLIAKFLLGCTYATVLTVAVGVLSWAAAAGFGEVRGVTFGGELVYSWWEMLRAYLYGAALGLLPLSAAVAFALFISTVTRSTAAAMTLVIGLWIVVDLLKYRFGVARFLFSSYIEQVWQVFILRCDGINESWMPMVFYCAGSSIGACVLFLILAIWALDRRDLSA